MLYLLHNSAYQARAHEFDSLYDSSSLKIEELFVRNISEEIRGTVRCVVPTGRLVRFLKRKIIRSVWTLLQKPTPDVLLGTLDGFIREEYNKALSASTAVMNQATVQAANDKTLESRRPQKKRLMSDAFRFAVFREAIEKCVRDKQLLFYSRDGAPISLAVAERLSDVIYGIKRKGIGPEDIVEDLESVRSGAQAGAHIHYARLHDVWRVYQAYESLLGETIFDMPAMTRELTLLLQQRQREQSTQNSAPTLHTVSNEHVFLDGFSEFTLPELEFLSCFTHSDTALSLSMNFDETNTALFGNFCEAREHLLRAGFIQRTMHEKFEQDDTSAERVQHVQKYFFHPQTQTESPPFIRADFANTVRILRTHNRADELSTIAKYIRHCILHENIAASDIAVVVRQPQNYTTLIREVFTAHEIPLNVSDRFSLATAPVISAVFSAVDVVLRSYQRDDIYRLLSNPFVAFTHEGTSLDAANLQRVALKLRMSGGERNGGAAGWSERLEKSLKSTRSQLQVMSEEGIADERDLQQQQLFLENIRRAKHDIEVLRTLLPARDLHCTPSEFHQLFIESFIKSVGIDETLARDAIAFHQAGIAKGAQKEDSQRTSVSSSVDNAVTRDTEAQLQAERMRRQEKLEQNTRAFNTLLALLDELEFILNDRGVKTMRLVEYIDILRSSVRAAKYQVREKTDYGVNITSIEQTRGIPYRVVILCGMVDLEFPLLYTPEHFLGKELPESEERHYRAERVNFYHALCNNPAALADGTWKMLLTYPAHSNANEEFLASPFLKELKRCVALAEEDYDTHQLRKYLREQSDQAAVDSTVDWCRDWIDAISSIDEALEQGSHRVDLVQFFQQRSLSDNIDFIAHILKHYATEHATEVELESQLDDASKAQLAKILDLPISATDLEKYAACPYQYFSTKILRLREEDEDSTALTPLELGNVLHQIVYRFYTDLAMSEQESGYAELLHSEDDSIPPAVIIELRAAREMEYLQRLMDIAEDETQKMSFDHPFFNISRDELFGLDDQPGLLQIWLKEELERATKWSFKPMLFEYGFGMRAPKGQREPVQLGSLKLRGKIDRIEVRKTAENEYEYLVADYKTRPGQVAKISEVQKGSKFQLPLYISAARELLQTRFAKSFEPGGGVYYIFKTDELRFHLLLVPADSVLVENKVGGITRSKTTMISKTREAMHETLDSSLDQAEDLVQKIAHGSFHVDAAPKVCDYCHFSSICRVKDTDAFALSAEEAKSDDTNDDSQAE